MGASLMPLARERLVVLLPFALEPDRRGGKSFLPERVHGHHMVAARGCSSGGIHMRRSCHRLGRQTENRILVVTAVHPIHAVTPHAFLGIRVPFQMAGPALLA